MIKKMIAKTRVRNGITTYTVIYESGVRRKFYKNDNWPMSVVLFYTADDTIRTTDEMLGSGEYVTRREVFEKA